jgi:hypothetical protein
MARQLSPAVSLIFIVVGVVLVLHSALARVEPGRRPAVGRDLSNYAAAFARFGGSRIDYYRLGNRRIPQ